MLQEVAHDVGAARQHQLDRPLEILPIAGVALRVLERRVAALAGALGLFTTGSSDYHGAGKRNRLGENTTEPEVLEAIQALGTGAEVVRR